MQYDWSAPRPTRPRSWCSWLCFEDDHYGGVGDVDTNLDDGGGNEDLCLATDELLHFGFFLGRLHLAVNLAEAELREHLREYLEAVLEVL